MPRTESVVGDYPEGPETAGRQKPAVSHPWRRYPHQPLDGRQTGKRKRKDPHGIKNADRPRSGTLIEENDCIIIASGTSVLALAKEIHPRGPLTVITAALNVALELLHHPQIEVIQLGGMLRKSSSSTTGPYAEKVLDDFSCNKLFLGVDGIDIEFGLTTTNAMEAHLNRKMIAAAQKTIILADSSKFGKRGFGRICGLEEVDQVITDAGISEHMSKTLKGMGIEVTVV